MIDVLIVDDYLEIVESMRENLEEAGLKTECISSGAEALTRIKDKTSQFRLALVDLGLGGEVEGLDVIKAIHSERPQVVVIAISGNIDDKIQTETLNAGAKEVWLKPFEGINFASKISGLLGGSTPPGQK